jgi:hypothetical protein
MKIKCGRYEYDITSNDTILDNGSSVRVLNRVTLNCKDLIISRKVFERLKKDNLLELVKKVDEWVVGGLKYYKIKEANQEE